MPALSDPGEDLWNELAVAERIVRCRTKRRRPRRWRERRHSNTNAASRVIGKPFRSKEILALIATVLGGG